VSRVLHGGIALLVLGAGVVGTWAVFEYSPQAEVANPDRPPPLVRVAVVAANTVELSVHAQGTVSSRTEIELVPEVPGRVTWVSPDLRPGGFFDEGEDLVRINARDYRLEVTRAEAEVARTKVVLAREQAEAELARSEWEALEPDKKAPPLALRKPQLMEAKALLKAAEANLEKAQMNLERTVVRAPFDGRVRSVTVDIGQFVRRGLAFAEIYAVDFVEIRLPLPDEELAFVDLPLRGAEKGAPLPSVDISTRFAGKIHHWEGKVVRVEGEIDTRTRMVHVVARVPDPYDRDQGGERPPLAAGMFVQAEITGKTIENVVAVPRGALRSATELLVVDVDEFAGAAKKAGVGKLAFRAVEVLRRERDRVLLSAGLSEGELVCLSPIEIVSEGMPVRFVELAGGGLLDRASEAKTDQPR